MTKKIVFISVAIQFARYQYAIGKKLEEKGVKVSYVTYSKEAEIFLKSKKAEVSYIPDEIKAYKLKKPLNLYLQDIEEKYKTNTELVLFEDYDHSQINRNEAFKSMIKNFFFWEDCIKKYKVDMVVGGIERFVGTIPNIICKKNKIRYYFWTRATIENNFILSQCIKEGHWSILNDYWRKNENRKLSLKEKKEAQKCIDTITAKKKNVYLVVGTPKVTFSQVLFFFKRFYLNIFVEKFRNPYARLTGIAWDKTKKAIRKYFLKSLYSKPNPAEKYFFYPLHLEEDAQIIVRAPQYADQVSLITYLAKCLPKGYKLYVKEHPNNIGGMLIKKLKAIKNINNVNLLSPYESSHDLIKKSKGIITINSNVGWEALLYKKPVITLGNCFYDISGLVWKARDLYRIPDLIKDSLNKPLINKEKQFRFVNAVLKSIYPGNLNFYYQYAKKAMVDENISLIADGVYRELNKN
ncbi:MAG: hypothetical protein KKA19_07975 [Candidatus Margulisbacteria bacterium]|nr:hypothetical protein [Candidatus Margulisiibacteriota bacterium]